MKIIASALFFIAAAITDIALNQNGCSNLPIVAGPLQVLGVVLFIIGIFEYIAEKKKLKK